MISREAILAKTHYGTGIYSHILRQFYPGEDGFSTDHGVPPFLPA